MICNVQARQGEARSGSGIAQPRDGEDMRSKCDECPDYKGGYCGLILEILGEKDLPERCPLEIGRVMRLAKEYGEQIEKG